MSSARGSSGNRKEGTTMIRVHFIDSSIKSDYRKTRRIVFSPSEFHYNDLIERLCILFPELLEQNFYLTCKDEIGNKFPVSCDRDFECAKQSNHFEKRLYAIVNCDFEDYDPEDSFRCQHFCDHCGYALKHYRFKCMICPQYETCKMCHQQNIHNKLHEMQFVKIPKAKSKNKILEMDYKSLIMKKQLGEGYYSKVYLAVTPSQTYAAVKQLKEKVVSEEDFKTEVKILKRVGQHENIVRILGCCEPPQTMAIVMEYVALSVDGKDCCGLNFYLMYLRDKFEQKNSGQRGKVKGLNHQELDSFALQVARGMDHLETRKIVHGDLAARNILIDNNKTLKLTDFGLAKCDAYEGAEVFQSRWSAPEVITKKNFSHKSDVWSFGIVLWEIATLGGEPYHNIKEYSKVNEFVGKRGGHLKKPGNVSKPLFEVMERCWVKTPNNRPSFKDLVQKLNDFKWMSSAYIPFDRLDPHFQLPPVYEPELKKFRKFFR